MNGKEYLKKFSKVSSLEEKQALLAKAKDEENEDRALFARKRDSWEVPDLDDPYKGLVPVFKDEQGGGQARFTDRKHFKEEEDIARLFDLGAKAREKKRQQPPTVPSLAKFKEQFLNVFSCNELQFLNWDNVVAAGGSISACVEPIPAEHDSTYIQRRKYYHDIAYGASDVDLFLYGLTAEEANNKLAEIYEAVCTACPFEVICFRSAHAVTMVSQYPYRHIQVVLRIYNSPYEVLAGFDIDSCTYLFDGKQVFTTPRGHHALVSGYNTIDMSRRSPSYETRLAKYASRGFEVLVPTFQRNRVDPNVFDKPWPVLKGLQKLVVLEQLRSAEDRLEYQTRHHKESDLRNRLRARRSVGRQQLERMEKAESGSEESNYATIFLPWGEGHSARSVLKLMRRKDLALNSSHFMKDRTFYLHPCYFGTALEVLQDCSPNDPDIPEDVPEAQIRGYVRGRLTWLEDDPGRQQIGSFNPITDQDWEEGTYFLTSNFDVCEAVNRDDVKALKKALEKLGPDWSMYQRDYLGRSPIHMGLLSGSVECCLMLLEEDLVDPTLRLPDGRSTLHLVAEYNRPQVMGALLESVKRFEKLWKAYEKKSKAEKDAMDEAGERPPRHIFLKEFVGARTFDQKWTALDISVVLGRVDIAKTLIENFGADPNSLIPLHEVTARTSYYGRTDSDLHLSLLLAPPQEGTVLEEMVDVLLDHGFDKLSNLLDNQLKSVLHNCVEFGNSRLLKAILEGLEKRGRDELVQKLAQWLDTDDRTALIKAVEGGLLDCAQILYPRFPHVYVTEEMKESRKLIKAQLKIDSPYPYYGRNQKVEGRENLVSAAAGNLVFSWMKLIDPEEKSLFSRQYSWVFPWTPYQGNNYFRVRSGGKHMFMSTDAHKYDAKPLREGIFAEDSNEESSREELEIAKSAVDRAAECLLWALEMNKEGKHDVFKHKFEMPNYLNSIELKPSFSRGDDDPRNSFGAKPITVSTLIQRLYALLCSFYLAMSQRLSKDDEKESFSRARCIAQRLEECQGEDSFDSFLLEIARDGLPSSETVRSFDAEPTQMQALFDDTQKLLSRVKVLKLAVEQYANASEGAISPRRLSLSVQGFMKGLRKSARKSTLKNSPMSQLFADQEADLIGIEEISKAAIAVKPKLTEAGNGLVGNSDSEEAFENETFNRYVVLTQEEDETVGRYTFSRGTAPTSVSDKDSRILNAYRAAYRGDVESVVNFLETSTDLGFSPFLISSSISVNFVTLTVARSKTNRAQVLRRLYELAMEKYSPPAPLKEESKSRSKTARIDNVKLMTSKAAVSDDDEESGDGEYEAYESLALSSDLDTFAAGKAAKLAQHKQSDLLNSDSSLIRINPVTMLSRYVPVDLDSINSCFSEELQTVFRLSVQQYLPQVGRSSTNEKPQLPKWKRTSLPSYAILVDDPELLREYLRITSTVRVPTEPLQVKSGKFQSLAHLAIGTNRLQCLEVLASSIGGAAPWQSISSLLGLSNAFAVKTESRYKGMSTVLDEKQTIKRSVGRRYGNYSRWYGDMSTMPTWMDLACMYGSRKVIDWIQNNPEDLVAAFDSLLQSPSEESEGIATILTRFATIVGEEIRGGRLPALQRIPDVKNLTKSPGSILSLLVVRAGRGDLTQLSPRNESPIFHLLTGNNVSTLAEIMQEMSEAERLDTLNAPCKVVVLKDNSNVDEDDTEEESTEGANISHTEEFYPIHVAAKRQFIPLLRTLLELGANPLQTLPISKRNALQIMAEDIDFFTMESAAYFHAAMKCYEEVVGRDTLLKALSQEDENGMNCFHKIFFQANARMVRALFEDYLQEDWLALRKKDGSSLLHAQLESTSVEKKRSIEMVQFLLEHMSLDSASTEENSNGHTAVDLLLRSRRTEHRPYLVGNHLPGDTTNVHWTSPGMITNLENHPLYEALQRVLSGHVKRTVPTYEAVRANVIGKVSSRSQYGGSFSRVNLQTRMDLTLFDDLQNFR